jgi:hypothetical protein
MLSSLINALRVFKGLYDLAFSEDQFYVEQRSEFWEEFITVSSKPEKAGAIQHLQEPTSGSRSRSSLES